MSKQVNIQDTITLNPSGYENLTSFTTTTSYPLTNAYDGSSSTTYARLTLNSGATGSVYFTFDTPDIPTGATIESVTASVRARVSSTNRVTNTSAQLYSGSTAKGSSSTFASTSQTNTFSLTTGTWTLSELQDIKLRISAYGASSSGSGSSSRYVYFYGADVSITYSLQTTQYIITATSTQPEVEVSPATSEILAGESQIISFNTEDFSLYKVTDNDIDVTSQLVQHTSEPGSFSNTFIPSEFDEENSIYYRDCDEDAATNGVYSTNYISNGLTDADSTTRCALYSMQGSGTVSKMYYNFDCSSIPTNAEITSVTCQFKGGSQGSTYYSNYTAQLTSGTTLKGTVQSVSGTNTSPTTVTINGGSSWTREELEDIKILFQVTRGTSNTTTNSTWSFYGATLTVNYEIVNNNPYYWTYELTNINNDHIILVDLAGAYIPPEEDPEYTY